MATLLKPSVLGRPLTLAEIEANMDALNSGQTDSIAVSGGTLNGVNVGDVSPKIGGFTRLNIITPLATAATPTAVSVGAAVAGYRTVTITATHAFSVSDTVTLTGFTGTASGLNGTYTVTSVSTTTAFSYSIPASRANATAPVTFSGIVAVKLIKPSTEAIDGSISQEYSGMTRLLTAAGGARVREYGDVSGGAAVGGTGLGGAQEVFTSFNAKLNITTGVWNKDVSSMSWVNTWTENGVYRIWGSPATGSTGSTISDWIKCFEVDANNGNTILGYTPTTTSGTVSTNTGTAVTLTAANANIVVGMTVTGNAFLGFGTYVTAVSGANITLSQAPAGTLTFSSSTNTHTFNGSVYVTGGLTIGGTFNAVATYLSAVSDNVTATASMFATNREQGKQIYMGAAGLARFGGDGTNAWGLLPPSGMKMIFPNIICCNATKVATNGVFTQTVPNATLTSRPKLVTGGVIGKINVDTALHAWYLQAPQAYSFIYNHVGVCESINFSEIASSFKLNNVGTGMSVVASSAQASALNISLCYGGGTVSKRRIDTIIVIYIQNVRISF